MRKETKFFDKEMSIEIFFWLSIATLVLNLA